MDKFGGIKENVEVVRSFDWWTVVIGVLIAIGIVMLCVKIKDFVVSTFGITTKSALAKQLFTRKLMFESSSSEACG